MLDILTRAVLYATTLHKPFLCFSAHLHICEWKPFIGPCPPVRLPSVWQTYGRTRSVCPPICSHVCSPYHWTDLDQSFVCTWDTDIFLYPRTFTPCLGYKYHCFYCSRLTYSIPTFVFPYFLSINLLLMSKNVVFFISTNSIKGVKHRRYFTGNKSKVFPSCVFANLHICK